MTTTRSFSLRPLLLSVGAAIAALGGIMFAAPAEAGDRYHRGGHHRSYDDGHHGGGHHRSYRGGHHGGHHYRHYNHRPRISFNYVAPQPVYYAPAPVYYAPQPVYYAPRQGYNAISHHSPVYYGGSTTAISYGWR